MDPLLALGNSVLEVVGEGVREWIRWPDDQTYPRLVQSPDFHAHILRQLRGLIDLSAELAGVGLGEC